MFVPVPGHLVTSSQDPAPPTLVLRPPGPFPSLLGAKVMTLPPPGSSPSATVSSSILKIPNVPSIPISREVFEATSSILRKPSWTNQELPSSTTKPFSSSVFHFQAPRSVPSSHIHAVPTVSSSNLDDSLPSTSDSSDVPFKRKKFGIYADHKRKLATALINRSIRCLNRMHVMEGECEKSSEMVAESAPELVASKTSIMELKLCKEELPTAEPGAPEPLMEPPAAAEPVVNGDTNRNMKEEKCDPSESAKPIEQDVTVNVNGDSAENSVSEGCRTKEESGKNVKNDAKELKEVKEVKEVKDVEVKEGSGGCSEEEDRQSVTSSQSRKRVALVEVEGEGENSSSESDGGGKRPRLEPDDGEDERERLVREYVEECTESVEEMGRAAEKLQREIGALGELLRAKELEWNSILRLRKLKEEMLERLLRRRRLATVLAENGVREEHPPNNISNKPKIINLNNVHQPPTSSSNTNNGSLMMVPIVSSGPGPYGRGPPRLPEPRGMPPRPQRPILPKPGPQEPIVGEGRSRHPENVPRRGRRMRGPEGVPGPASGVTTRISGSPALMSMANMALGSGSHVRENPPFMGQENSRPSSADSSRSGHHLDMLPGPGSGGLSFKDALVQFAKMSQPNKPPPPPPPYPEVTLHPVPAPHSPPAPPPHSSLLHGILTKSAPGPRATTFSPTLARLLTAPERAPTSTPMPPTPTFRPPHHHVPPHQRGVNISEILSSSKKNRNEITITPVSGSNKTKDDVVMLQEEDEEGDGDRLVIDEGRDNGAAAGAGGELPENVPQCQGCHQRAAQFVCAGCGNQWYCSRDCQVNAWEEHSEMCSG